MYGNFVEKFPSNGTGIFFLAPKTGTGLSFTMYKIPVNVSLSLEHEAWHWYSTQIYGTENFGRFGKNGKKVIPRKVLLFCEKFPPG